MKSMNSVPVPMNSAESISPLREVGFKFMQFMKLFLRNKLAALGLLLIVVWTLIAITAPLIAPYAPDATDLSAKLNGPSSAHWFGTDQFGRDILSRVIHASQISIWTGIIAVAISFFIGVPLGGIAAYYGGWLGNVIMRVMDIFLAFPSLILAMAIAAAMGPGLISAMIAVGIVGIPEFARLMYSQTIYLKEREFVEASRSIGVRNRAILIRHIFPNALAPLLVRITLGMGFAILTAASLSFLGLGVKPPLAEWGAMISDGREYIITGEWWIVTFPGLAIATTILGFNLLGDGLRDVLDPRLRTSRK